MEQIENHMVVDWWWKNVTRPERQGVSRDSGYRELSTGVFVAGKDAYAYALEQCLRGADQKEFREMLVEWYYSGNWRKEGADGAESE